MPHESAPDHDIPPPRKIPETFMYVSRKGPPMSPQEIAEEQVRLARLVNEAFQGSGYTMAPDDVEIDTEN